MSISSKELANILGISPSTVSMVFNNKPGISEDTRVKVLEAAKEYGYKYSEKKAPKAQVGTIYLIIYKKHGAIINDTPFFFNVTEGIEKECRRNNCNLQIKYFDERNDLSAQIDSLNNDSCSGILLLATEMDETDFIIFNSLKKPLVVLDCYYDELQYDSVIINNVQGAYIATEYLIKNGCKKIGYLHSNVKISNFSERADGYYKALRRYNIDTSHPYIVEVRPTTEGAYKDMLTYLNTHENLPDGFFADNDIIAAACMKAFSEKGIKIPNDISIVGFDDIPIGELLTPPLTTMNVPKHSLGSRAVRTLLNRIGEQNLRQIKLELSTQIVERGSVKKI